MKNLNTQCMNCSEKINKGPYCENCGQKSGRPRLQFSELLQDFNSQLFELDLPWLHTLIEMTLNPGQVCLDYVNGKRIRYVNPLKYMIYLFAVITILSQLLPVTYTTLQAPVQGAIYQNYNFFQRVIYDNPIIQQILACFILSFVIRVLYPKTHFNKTEINTASLFIFGHVLFLTFILSIIFGVINEAVLMLFTTPPNDFLWSLFIFLMVFVPYFFFTYACKSFFKQSWLITSFKSIFLMLSFFLIRSAIQHLAFDL